MRKFLSEVFIVALITGIGFLLCAGFFYAWMQGFFVQWKRLPGEPAQIREIVGARTGVVYVSAADGFYDCYSGSAEGTCWGRTGWPVEIERYMGCYDSQKEAVRRLLVAPFLGKVVDRETAVTCFKDENFVDIYILTDEGQVWNWSPDFGDQDPFEVLLQGTFIGTLVSFTLGLIFLPQLKKAIYQKVERAPAVLRRKTVKVDPGGEGK